MFRRRTRAGNVANLSYREQTKNDFAKWLFRMPISPPDFRITIRRKCMLTFSDPIKTTCDVFEKMKNNAIFGSQANILKVIANILELRFSARNRCFPNNVFGLLGFKLKDS